uniref:Large ribosomal subunit protein mL38 n=1 Tax=Sparus aurata TaxID=8175 RepID=A0A671XCH2_SPAAU
MPNKETDAQNLEQRSTAVTLVTSDKLNLPGSEQVDIGPTYYRPKRTKEKNVELERPETLAWRIFRSSVPQISFDAEEDSLWTLLLTCPDEHLLDNEAEYIHWLVGNIPGGAMHAGEELCHYLPPFPARGTGFHCYIYVLFKQEGTINFQEDVRPLPCHSLVDCKFKTLDFYRKHQDNMTPVGLAFFQCQWDESVTNTFHNTLNRPTFYFWHKPTESPKTFIGLHAHRYYLVHWYNH